MVELLIAIAVLGIMAAGLLYLIDPLGQIQKANDARRKSDLEQLQRTLEVYYNDNGIYPPNSSSGNYGTSPFCTGNNYRILPTTSTCYEWGTVWTAYNTTLPKDPKSSRNYVYYSTGQSYWLYASLERGSKDSQVCNPDNNTETDDACTNAPADATCGSVCNFGVSSPNTSP